MDATNAASGRIPRRSHLDHDAEATLRPSAALAPTVDLPFDRFRHIATHELAELAIDRFNQVGTRAIDDWLQVCAELIAQTGVREKVEALQNLHAYLLGHRIPIGA